MSRRRAREMVLRTLYKMDIKRHWTSGEIEAAEKNGEKIPEDVKIFFHKVTDGVIAHRQSIDRLIEKCSEHWKVDRMSAVDRNILRMAVFELQHCIDVPAKVTINEAVELGKRYNSEESASFINALLDRIAKQELNRDPEKEA